MKVLHQLIKHFWQRGALTYEQGAYLVEHGFIRAYELGLPEPSSAASEYDDATPIDVAFPTIDLDADPLEDHQRKLSAEAPAKRKGGSRTARVPDYSPEQLGVDLREILRKRKPTLAALAKLAGQGNVGWDAAAVLRKLTPTAFRQRLLVEINASPSLLAKLWDSVDAEPYYALLAQSHVRGPAARAFNAIVTATSPGAWGTARWLLKVPEVQIVANLMATRLRCVQTIRWLYEKHRPILDRCCRRPARPARSWSSLGFGLVLLYNARAWKAKQKPTGYELAGHPNGGWAEAWTTAIQLDSERVIPFCVHIFGNVPDRDGTGGDFAVTDCPLICPASWKV